MADVILYLVDRESFNYISNHTVSDLINLLNNKELSVIRPESFLDFHRDFDVDIEGDILDIFDKNENLLVTNDKISDITIELKNDLILLLAKWSSVAKWSCWDARLFLYIEPFLDKKVMNIDEMIYTALVKRYESQIAESAATLKIYFDSPVGIGEHPQHIDEMDKLLGKIADAQGRLDVLVDQWDDKHDKPLPF